MRSNKAKRTPSAYVAALVVVVLMLSVDFRNTFGAVGGDLDQSFGTGGKLITGFGNNSAGATAVVLQSDGKIVAVGSIFGDSTFNSDFVLARYATNGSLDPSFGMGGVVVTDFFGDSDFPRAAAIQRDGKILVVGAVLNGLASSDFGLARYNIDGSLDVSFGVDGKVACDFGQSRFDRYDSATGLALQDDGRIVVVGYAAAGQNLDVHFGLARFNDDGSLDPSFGSGGLATTEFLGQEVAMCVAVQPDGRIVLGGYAARNHFATTDFALVRYNTDGTLDNTFGTGGVAINDFGNGMADYLWALAIQGDGKIVGVGETWTNIPPNHGEASRFAILRYTASGSPDSTFASEGKQITAFGAGDLFARAEAVKIQRDGKIIASGSSQLPFSISGSGVVLARYNSNGALDSTFGVAGKITTLFGEYATSASALAIQQDGKIVTAGRAVRAGAKPIDSFALARYLGSTFDLCLQDDNNFSLLQINSTSGEYSFTDCGATSLGGIGAVSKRGCLVTLRVGSGDRRVNVQIDTCQRKGFGSIQILSQGRTFSFIDRDTANNSCGCP
jgi:uncharacterized delta-60 repeat protein